MVTVPTCEICGREIGRGETHYRRTTGWQRIENRGQRGQLSCVEDQERWLCIGCIQGEQRRHKGKRSAVARGQETLA